MEKENLIKTVVATLGTGFTWLYGTWDKAIAILVVFIVLDYLTGISRAYINKEVSSSVGAKGIAKKAVIFVVLIVGVMLDRLLSNDVWVFRTLVAYFYIANEGISLLENCSGLGLPVPNFLKDALLQLKSNQKKDINKGGNV